MIIGKSKSPRALKNVNLKNFNVEYDYSAKSWINSRIFCDWLERLNYEMAQQKRTIALLLDNATCHNTELTFSNINLIYLPKNTTSLIQPCDQGIIKSFKTKYTNLLVQIIADDDKNENNFTEYLKGYNILDVIYLVEKSWSDVSNQTIINCFKKAVSFNIVENETKPRDEVS